MNSSPETKTLKRLYSNPRALSIKSVTRNKSRQKKSRRRKIQGKKKTRRGFVIPPAHKIWMKFRLCVSRARYLSRDIRIPKVPPHFHTRGTTSRTHIYRCLMNLWLRRCSPSAWKSLEQGGSQGSIESDDTINTKNVRKKKTREILPTAVPLPRNWLVSHGPLDSRPPPVVGDNNYREDDRRRRDEESQRERKKKR